MEAGLKKNKILEQKAELLEENVIKTASAHCWRLPLPPSAPASWHLPRLHLPQRQGPACDSVRFSTESLSPVPGRLQVLGTALSLVFVRLTLLVIHVLALHIISSEGVALPVQKHSVALRSTGVFGGGGRKEVGTPTSQHDPPPRATFHYGHRCCSGTNGRSRSVAKCLLTGAAARMVPWHHLGAA